MIVPTSRSTENSSYELADPMPDPPQLLLIAGALVLLSTLASKLSERIGVPTLLMLSFPRGR